MTSREQVSEKIRSRRAELGRFGVKRLSLFGSFARGEARPDSDIDILVEFTDEAKRTDYYGRFMDVVFYLEALLGRKVDLATPAMVRRIRPNLGEESVFA